MQIFSPLFNSIDSDFSSMSVDIWYKSPQLLPKIIEFFKELILTI